MLLIAGDDNEILDRDNAAYMDMRLTSQRN